MGTMHIPTDIERAMLRHYDEPPEEVVKTFLRDRLRDEGLFNDDGEYDPDGANVDLDIKSL